MIMLCGLTAGVSHGRDTAGANASAEVEADSPTTDPSAQASDDHGDADRAGESVEGDQATDASESVEPEAAPEGDPNGAPENAAPDQQAEPADDSVESADDAETTPFQRQVGRMMPQASESSDDQSSEQLPAEPQVTEQALRQRVLRLLREPAEPADEEPAQRQLRDLSREAADLAEAVAPPAERLRALNLRMQALYKQLSTRPRDPQVDRLLFNLRAAARQAKAIDAPDAAAIGDFWLTTADLFDLNRIGLSIEARRKQAAQLLSDYLLRHPEGPAAEQARYAIEQLNAAVSE